MLHAHAMTLRHLSAIVLAAGLATGAASPSLAQVAPGLLESATKVPHIHDDGPGLPFFDIRLSDQSLPLPAVTAKITAARANGQRAAAIAALQTAIPGLAVDEDLTLGTPKFIRSTQAFLTAPLTARANADAAGVAVVRDFIAAHPAILEVSPREIDRARVLRDYRTDHNGARHLTFQQQIRSVDLFGCEVRANLSRTGELINIGSTMLARPEGSDFETPAIRFTDAAAIVIAAAAAGVDIPAERWPAPETDAVGPAMKRTWPAATAADFRVDEPGEPVTTELVYFPLDRDTIHPAWQVILPTRGIGHTYEIIIDATDGALLRRHDRLVWDTTQPVTMNVYLSDGVAPGSPGNPTPTSFQFPLAARTLKTWLPADVSAYSPNGWINDGNTQTVGNNVDGHTDLDASNTVAGVDLPRPDGGASRIFDFPLDPAQEPTTYSAASVVQLFYRANFYHDRLMSLGFNEAAGNFQTTNFTGLGAGADAVQLDCQDSVGVAATSSNRNNANFNTSGSDGSSARCQMYVFTAPTPDRDGSLDGDIVFHELTHGTSIRLHGGLSGTSNQPTGMGEGWGDYYGISLLAEPTDDPDAVYGTGGYTTYLLFGAGFNTNYYYGIRRYPYCTNLLKNPLTYKFIDTAQLVYPATSSVPRNTAITSAANEVHASGEVWCMALLECRAALWHAYGFAGNERMLQLVTDGMKLSPANPNFIQARDAILQADQADYGGADLTLLWQAFAKRGLGFSAASPGGVSTSGVVEASDLPIFATFTYPDGRPTQLAPGAPTTFRVNVAGTGLSLLPNTGTMYLSLNGGAFAPVALTSVGTNQYSATIPAQSCFSRAAFYFSAGTSVGDKTDPAAAPTSAYRASVSTGAANFLTEGFETDSGWTVGPNTATTGLWERATPQATAAQPGGAHGGSLCFVTSAAAGASVGANDVDGGQTTLLSPAFNLAASSDFAVSYWRWYSNGAGSNPFTNTFRVDISTDNGTTWTNAETIGPASSADTNPGWRFASWKLSDLAGGSLTPTDTVRVRFIAEDATASVVEAAIDDFAIDLISCTPPATCAADFNHSGDLTVQDIFDFLNGWFAGSPAADFNGGGLTVQDIFDYLNAWFAGC